MRCIVMKLLYRDAIFAQRLCQTSKCDAGTARPDDVHGISDVCLELAIEIMCLERLPDEGSCGAECYLAKKKPRSKGLRGR